jgi:two-component system, LytTR family, response regulator
MKVLIIDDEPIARQIVRQFCSQIEGIEVIAEACDAIEAQQILTTEHIDLMFLDINMPMLNGLVFLKMLQTRPQVILTTAYNEFALDAFDIGVTDYLLKPFSFERFEKAYQRALLQFESAEKETEINTQSVDNKHFILKSETKIYKVDKAEILYCEVQGNISKVILKDKKIEVYLPFYKLIEQLPCPEFVRIHRSFLVNKNFVNMIDGNNVVIASENLPISPNNREDILRQLGF